MKKVKREKVNWWFYEMSHKWLHKTIIKNFIKKKIPLNNKILDIWCGNGNMIKNIFNLWYKNLYWCDWFTINKNINTFCKFTEINLNNKLPYPNNEFNFIFLTEVIEHMENANILLNEIHRILKIGWIVMISTPNIVNLFSRILFLIEGNFLLFRASDIKFESFPWHISPFFPNMFIETFKNKFLIENFDYSNLIMPILGTEFKIQSKFLSNTIILSCKKI